jgi:hypothetical protein
MLFSPLFSIFPIYWFFCSWNLPIITIILLYYYYYYYYYYSSSSSKFQLQKSGKRLVSGERAELCVEYVHWGLNSDRKTFLIFCGARKAMEMLHLLVLAYAVISWQNLATRQNRGRNGLPLINGFLNMILSWYCMKILNRARKIGLRTGKSLFLLFLHLQLIINQLIFSISLINFANLIILVYKL